MTRSRFDELFDGAAPLVEAQQHQRDVPPVEGGRWPVSVVLRPDEAAASHLHDLTLQALSLCGPGHFGTGLLDSSHFTVRALERYREVILDDDPTLARYRTALERAAGRSVPITLRLTGVTLTPLTVMLTAEPVDPAADRFAAALRDELGPDGWREASFRRDIWYATLVHFAADIVEPGGLVAWVRERRRLELGRSVARQAQLVRFRYRDGVQPARVAPEVLAVAELS